MKPNLEVRMDNEGVLWFAGGPQNSAELIDCLTIQRVGFQDALRMDIGWRCVSNDAWAQMILMVPKNRNKS